MTMVYDGGNFYSSVLIMIDYVKMCKLVIFKIKRVLKIKRTIEYRARSWFTYGMAEAWHFRVSAIFCSE